MTKLKIQIYVEENIASIPFEHILQLKIEVPRKSSVSRCRKICELIPNSLGS